MIIEGTKEVRGGLGVRKALMVVSGGNIMLSAYSEKDEWVLIDEIDKTTYGEIDLTGDVKIECSGASYVQIL